MADLEIAKDLGASKKPGDDGTGPNAYKKENDEYVKKLELNQSQESDNAHFFEIFLLQDNWLSMLLPCYGW